MENLLIYLLKSAAILSIFFLVYQLLLSNEVGFSANRKFLIGGILGAFLLPSVEFTRNINLPETIINTNYSDSLNPVASNASSFEIWDLLGFIYLGVLSVLLFRFTIQLFSIIRLIAIAKPIKIDGLQYIETRQEISPFSFFHFIIYNPQLYNKKELNLILCHEKIHASQWHSADILLAQLTSCILWFNPLSWFYKKAIPENLEFIADEETILALGEKITYQQTLVKAAFRQMPPALTNNFYQSFIKKRILMLNKSNQKPQKIWKMSLVFPLILAFLLSFNVKTEARISPSQANNTSTTSQVNQQILEAHFSANTTEKDLENYKSRFAENNVQLEWLNKNFKEGKLKTLHLKYILETGDSKEFKSKNNENGKLVPFTLKITLKKNGEVIRTDFLGPTKSATAENKYTVSRVIYKIDGKEVKKSKVDALDPNEIESVNIFKGEKAAARTDKKVDDVIEIKLKDKEGRDEKGTGFIESKKKVEKTAISFQNYSKTKKNLIPEAEDINARQNHGFRAIEIKENPSLQEVSFPAPPLIIVDDKTMPADFNMDSIDPEDIKSINVHKGKSATDYKNGENGVIEITTKN